MYTHTKEAQKHRDTETQRHRGKIARRHRDRETVGMSSKKPFNKVCVVLILIYTHTKKRHRDTETARHREIEAQKHRDIETWRPLACPARSHSTRSA